MSVYQTITNQTVKKTFVTNQFACFNNVFTKDELKKIIEISIEIPLVDGDTASYPIDDESKYEQPRVSKINHQRLNENNKWIFDRLNQLIMHCNWEFFNYDLTGYEFYQYAEYRAKDLGHYIYHTDIIFGGDNLRGLAAGFETRKLSMSLLLNDPEVDFEGGGFYINVGGGGNVGAEIKELKLGSAILFPSWLMHKVAPVTKGIRKSLTVWVTGPKFR
jgi:PKHD-type hydroxylase